MSQREQARLQVLNRVVEGIYGMEEAAKVLGVSERHGWRLLAAYRKEGAAAFAHGNRGRKPAHALGEETRIRVRELAQGRYQGVNHCHLTELLAEGEGLVLSRATVRRILAAAGVNSPRRRRSPKHRIRRERYPQEGMLLQVDGSRHHWLEGRGFYLTLVGAIDDATGTVPFALFREQEDAQGYFLVLEEIARSKGIPLALYSDRHSIFQVNPKQRDTLEEQLAGERQPTQLGRALRELGIKLLLAQTPQAKGRVERLWGTFQDRLVAELRLAGASNAAEANEVLWRFLPRFNERFGVLAVQPGSAYRHLPPSLHLEEVLCFKYQRTVARDNTVRFGGRTLQLLPTLERRSYARARVEVQERLDGSLVVAYRGQVIATTEAPPHAVVLRARKNTSRDPLHPPVSLRVGVSPNGTQGSGGDGQGPDHEGARPQAGRTPTPPKPGPHHPWRRPLLTKSLNT